MSHIYAGNTHLIDPEVLDALATLPDDFWVYLEFDCNRRNVDCLVIRAVPDSRPERQYSTLIMTELKRTTAILSGGENGRWTETRNGQEQELVPGNTGDENYWRQTLNTLNQLKSWMFINQTRYMNRPGRVVSEHEIKIWPNLLIISPSDVQHRLPLVPASRFGAFHHSISDWRDKTLSWRPREGVQLTAAETETLAAVLRLERVPVNRPVPQVLSPSEVKGPFEWLQQFTDAAALFSKSSVGMADWASGIETRLSAMERQLGRAPSMQVLGDQAVRREPPAPSITPQVRELLRSAVSNVRRADRRTDVHAVDQALMVLAGPQLQETQYFGFRTAAALLNAAQAQGVVASGPLEGGVPTVLLPPDLGADPYR